MRILINKRLDWNSINKFYYGLNVECDERLFVEGFYSFDKLSSLSKKKYNYYARRYPKSLNNVSGYKNFVSNLRLSQKLNHRLSLNKIS